jgi:hypothetical protein
MPPFPRLIRLLIATALLLGPAAPAQTPASAPAPPASASTPTPLGLSPDDASALLGKLQQLHQDFASSKKEMLSSALARIRTATASESASAELYLAAWKIVNLDRHPVPTGGDAPAPQDDAWRDRLIEWMKETGAPKAIRVQLAWLALTIEASQTPEADVASLLPKARDLAKQAAAAALATPAESTGTDPRRRDRKDNPPRERGGPRQAGGNISQILNQSVMQSVFAQAYNLESYIKPPPGWSPSPLNLDTIYGGLLLPYYRKHQPAELPALWDEWIQFEAAMHRAAMDEVAFLAWGQIQGKNLQWRKHLDLLEGGVGGPASGDELVRLFKDSPTHPNLGQWKKDLENLTAKITGEPQ